MPSPMAVEMMVHSSFAPLMRALQECHRLLYCLRLDVWQTKSWDSRKQGYCIALREEAWSLVLLANVSI